MTGDPPFPAPPTRPSGYLTVNGSLAVADRNSRSATAARTIPPSASAATGGRGRLGPVAYAAGFSRDCSTHGSFRRRFPLGIRRCGALRIGGDAQLTVLL